MPLTGDREKDIPELMDQIKRTGKFGNMKRSMGKEKMRRAALAAAYSAERRKKAKKSRKGAGRHGRR